LIEIRALGLRRCRNGFFILHGGNLPWRLETVSIEQTTEPTENHDSVPRPEYIADWRETPAQLVQRKETRQMIDDALDQLDEKHRLFLNQAWPENWFPFRICLVPAAKSYFL
jgi:hypothetical protein